MMKMVGAGGAAKKWIGLVAGMWVEASAGNAYTFAFYSTKLKHVLHYHQFQLNNLGVAKDIGENVGLLAGALCNSLPPWVMLSIGATSGFIGYGMLWLVVSQQIAPLPYWQMCILQCIGANSSTWLSTAVLVTCLRNFPHSRGTVAGILKGFMGLSAAIFTQIFISLLCYNSEWLLLLLAIGPGIVCLIAMLFIRPVSPASLIKDKDEHGKFLFIHLVCIALALYLLSITFVENLLTVNPIASKIFTAIMAIFLTAPLAVPMKSLTDGSWDVEFATTNCNCGRREEKTTSLSDKENSDDDNGALSPPRATQAPPENELEFDSQALLAVGEGAVRRQKRPRRGQDFTLGQAIVKADFWLLFLSFFCGVGSGVTAINNLAQMGEAQGYSDVSIFVSLISIWNFLGRLGGGAVSEHYVRSDAIPRSVWMAMAHCLMASAHLLFAFAVPGSLYVGSVILGISYGIHFSTMVPTASELFGLKHFGVIYNFLTMASPLGSFLFSGVITGYLYDQEAKKKIAPDARIVDTFLNNLHNNYDVVVNDDHVQVLECIGAHCFKVTFIIMACVCGLGILVSIVLTIRIRRVYLSLYGPSTPPIQSTSDLKSSASNTHPPTRA
ncbi:unnamed protein product [Sphagnum troendelagicum]|uniref:Nodulin-like domain-containing protein n=1 Tax=Sphagnum troendelagicum TaxID=128251 RepID=A0ABP0TRB7_9BRYO